MEAVKWASNGTSLENKSGPETEEFEGSKGSAFTREAPFISGSVAGSGTFSW